MKPTANGNLVMDYLRQYYGSVNAYQPNLFHHPNYQQNANSTANLQSIILTIPKRTEPQQPSRNNPYYYLVGHREINDNQPTGQQFNDNLAFTTTTTTTTSNDEHNLLSSSSSSSTYSLSKTSPPTREILKKHDKKNNLIRDSNKRRCERSESIEVNFCYTAWICMCLGFLFIWSSVISLIFIANKMDESALMKKPLQIFMEQERIGRIMFAVGQEMLFTVDSLVSIHLNLSEAEELQKSVNFTWDLTDDDIEDVKCQMDSPTSDLIQMIASIESKLESIRSNLSLATDHPLTMINSYKLIFDFAEQYSVEKNLLSSTVSLSGSGALRHDSQQWHLIKSFAQIQTAPYALFIKGMNRRFIELAYGTIYHIGPQLFNRTDFETEVSNYFYYFYSSHELIENAFAWDSRIYHRYMELLRTNKPNSVLQTSTGSNVNVYRLSGREYTRFVTDVVAYLLRAKDVLNVGLRELLSQITTNNPTMYYSVISCIYLIALITCSTFFILFIRNAKFKQELDQDGMYFLNLLRSQSFTKKRRQGGRSPADGIENGLMKCINANMPFHQQENCQYCQYQLQQQLYPMDQSLSSSTPMINTISEQVVNSQKNNTLPYPTFNANNHYEPIPIQI